jgi:hypothetical protein
VSVRYPTLEDHLHAAAHVLDLPVETVIKAARSTSPNPRCTRLKRAGARRRPFSTCRPSPVRAENLEAVEAAVAGWIAERLRPPSRGG